MPRYHFLQLDVFTQQPFGGNQLAVFTDASGLDTQQMQALTREMNFSESTFILPSEIPGCVRKIRIFTPGMEMPMAGHPTVGTAAALIGRKMVAPENGAITVELGIGPVRVDVGEAAASAGDGLLPFVWMNHRMPEFSPSPANPASVAAALGLEPSDLNSDVPLEVVSTGVPFLFVPLVSLEVIGRARSEAGALARLFAGGPLAHVALFTRQTVDSHASFHLRMYSPHLAGIVEDPATGSMAAPFGAYAARHALLPKENLVTFTLEQGLEMQRPSQIYVEVGRQADAFTSLRIGGNSVLVGEGEIFW